MTTDDKTDSKANEGRSPDSSGSAGQSGDSQKIDPKITVIESQKDQSCAQIVSSSECLEDSQQPKAEPKPDSDVPQPDVHMKSAESVEDMSITITEPPVASSSTADNAQEAEAEEEKGEQISFKLIFKKNNYDISIGINAKVSDLKERIQKLTSVAPAMQKLLYKGIPLNDNKTISETGIKTGAKVMLIGSTLTDVIAVNSTTKEDVKEEKASTSAREPLCKQKVIDRGIPDDVMPAWKNGSAPLPREPLHGMINKYNHKVRLTFKLEQDQLWVGTKERTEKLSMMSIRSVVSEPIEDHPEYHVMGIQTGPTEASRIWLYWVPAQFVDAIKDTILGK